MKKWTVLICLLPLLLSGCAAGPPAEKGEPPPEAVPASAEAEPQNFILFGVPADAEIVLRETGGRCVYVQEAGDYEIVSDILPTGDLDEAVRLLTGFGPEKLDILETRRFGLPEYRFAWASASDGGGFVSRASLIRDGGSCYALIFSVREGLGTAYDECADAVFASFGLCGDEQF